MPVTRKRYSNGICYPICPQCGNIMERDNMAFCGQCGQKLDWKKYSRAVSTEWTNYMLVWVQSIALHSDFYLENNWIDESKTREMHIHYYKNKSGEFWTHRFYFYNYCEHWDFSIFNLHIFCFFKRGYASGGQLSHILYYFRKEGANVKKNGQELIVHCFYTEEGEDLRELVLQSLRFFIERNLQEHAAFWTYE